MDRLKWIWLLSGISLITSVCAEGIKPILMIKTDKRQAVTGGLIKLDITVKAPGIKSVSWKNCDSVIKNIPNVKILKIAGYKDANSFHHRIVFTSIKPGDITIDRLPIVIRYAGKNVILSSHSNIVKFSNEPVAADISDINPIYSDSFASFKYLLYPCLPVAGIILALITTYSFIKKRKEKSQISLQNIQNIALEKLQLLENQMGSSPSLNNEFGDKIFDVLKEYLKQMGLLKQPAVSEYEALMTLSNLTLETSEKERINEILDTSLRVRFSIINRHSVTDYMNNVRNFISGSSQLASKD